MIVLVCGGRDYNDAARLNAVLDHLHNREAIRVLIQGGARGADSWAHKWALDRGVHVAEVKAMWHRFGPSAGPQRNAAMLALKPDYVVAFPGGTGTAHMTAIARAKGVSVLVIKDKM
jgi:hypothetical protein